MATKILPSPIWKDYYVGMGAGPVEWNLLAPDDRVIYNGISYRRPKERAVRVKVNDICASWMRTEAAKAATSAVFRIKGLNNALDVSFSFLYDWSYDINHDTVTQGMLAPISRHLSRKQLLAFSQYDADDVDIRGYMADGTYRDVLITAGTKTIYEDLYGWGFDLPYGQPDIYNIVTSLESDNMKDFVSIEFSGVRYEIDDKCSRYALYYMNAYGGWETLLLRGRVSFSESYNRHLYTFDYNNSVTSVRGEVNYMNEVDDGVVMRTGWLTDEGAANIRHLTGSTWVYLHDMDEGTFIPLVLTDSSVDKKSYRGEGAQLVSYVVNARVAREMMRL